MPFFDRFEKIYLWLDADEVGKASAEKFAEVLGPNRTIIIDPSFSVGDCLSGDKTYPKDANDALRQGLSLENIMINKSRWLD